jgi:hypothetical protein
LQAENSEIEDRWPFISVHDISTPAIYSTWFVSIIGWQMLNWLKETCVSKSLKISIFQNFQNFLSKRVLSGLRTWKRSGSPNARSRKERISHQYRSDVSWIHSLTLLVERYHINRSISSDYVVDIFNSFDQTLDSSLSTFEKLAAAELLDYVVLHTGTFLS